MLELQAASDRDYTEDLSSQDPSPLPPFSFPFPLPLSRIEIICTTTFGLEWITAEAGRTLRMSFCLLSLAYLSSGSSIVLLMPIVQPCSTLDEFSPVTFFFLSLPLVDLQTTECLTAVEVYLIVFSSPFRLLLWICIRASAKRSESEYSFCRDTQPPNALPGGKLTE